MTEPPKGYRLLIQCIGIADKDEATRYLRRVFGQAKLAGLILEPGVELMTSARHWAGPWKFHPDGGWRAYIPVTGLPLPSQNGHLGDGTKGDAG